jgi:hypothetical protein
MEVKCTIRDLNLFFFFAVSLIVINIYVSVGLTPLEFEFDASSRYYSTTSQWTLDLTDHK